MAENQRRKTIFKQKKKEKSNINFVKGNQQQNIIVNLPTSEEEEDSFNIIGVDGNNILIVGSHILIIFSMLKQKIINSIRFNFSVIDFKLMQSGNPDEHILFKIEQNQLELVHIQCNTFQSHKNFVFKTKIKSAIPHPSSDFILILDDQNNIGIFDLMNVSAIELD
jgi:hypothetical protein